LSSVCVEGLVKTFSGGVQALTGVSFVVAPGEFVGILGPSGAGLKMTDRQRYGSPMHPGDSFSYDIFSQAGEAIRHPAGVSAIGGLTPAVGKATNRAVRAGFVLKSYARLIKAAAAESDIGK